MRKSETSHPYEQCEPCETITPSGASIVYDELTDLLDEFNRLYGRLSERIDVVLTPPLDTTAINTPLLPVRSAVFQDLYGKIRSCRCMIEDFHSLIDRIDL